MEPTLIPLPLTPAQLQEALVIPQSTHVLSGEHLLLDLLLCGKLLRVSMLTSILCLFTKLSARQGFLEHYLACCIVHLFPLSPFTCLFFFKELNSDNSWLLSFINSEILSVETRAVILHNLRETKLWQINLTSLITQAFLFSLKVLLRKTSTWILHTHKKENRNKINSFSYN